MRPNKGLRSGLKKSMKRKLQINRQLADVQDVIQSLERNQGSGFVLVYLPPLLLPLTNHVRIKRY
ncbi:hypothetical protein CKO08_12165 [Halorhodospira halochloris]|nr:hypothetical protein [Halorhodospira halochloris]